MRKSNIAKVSVIVPFYNCEKTITRCAMSLFAQTLDDIEYIFVDDCSTDNSYAVLQNVVDLYSDKRNIIVIRNEKNLGCPQARKEGFIVASGEYIIYCDGDDYVDAQMYQIMYEKAVHTRSDIVLCDHFFVHENGTELIYSKNFTDFTSPLSVVSDILTRKIDASVWIYLCKRELYNDTFVFPHCQMIEDVIIMIQLLLNASKVSKTDKALYYYCYNEQGITKKEGEQYVLQRYKDTLSNIDILETFFSKKGMTEYFKDALLIRKIKTINFLDPLLNKREYRRMWKNTYPGILITALRPKSGLPIKMKGGIIIRYLGLFPLFNAVRERN